MSSNTEKLNLLKVDTVADGEQYFNVDTMLNANWDKVDAFADQIGDKVDGDLLPRLNTSATSSLVLQPGTQTIQIARDTPFNLSGITGRMLLNLLGRNGNCESLVGWTFSGTGALNTANVSSGSASIQITIGTTSGNMARSVPVKVGATYILAASIKLGTATGALVSVTNVANGTIVNSSTGFTTSYMRFTASAASHNIAVVIQGAQGQTAYIDSIRLYEVSSTEYNQLSSMKIGEVEKNYPYTEGFAGVKNPYAIRWTDSSKTELAALLAFDTELLGAPASELDRDVLQTRADGSYYRTTTWRKLILTGAINWLFSTDGNRVGYKKVYFSQPDITSNVYAINFRQEPLVQTTGSVSDYGANMFYVNTSTRLVEFSIAQADSGWGDNYTPSTNEIKAYFYGWKMYDTSVSTDGSGIYNRTDGQNKAWARRTNGLDASGGYAEGVLVLPTTTATGSTPYSLMYKRSATISEPVVSEGALSFVQGNNTFDVGSGLIIRETAKPQATAGYYWINGNTPINSSAKDKVLKFLNVYRNGRADKWNFLGFSSDADKVVFGAQQARILTEQYSSDDTYSFSYFSLRNYPVGEFVGLISNNERAILDDLTRDIQQLTDRVSVSELRKVEKETTYPWVSVTLLNGVTPYTGSSDYRQGLYVRKKENMLELSGLITNVPNGVIVARLPVELRPLFSSTVPVIYENNLSSNAYIFRLKVSVDGGISITYTTSAASPWVSVSCIIPLD